MRDRVFRSKRQLHDQDRQATVWLASLADPARTGDQGGDHPRESMTLTGEHADAAPVKALDATHSLSRISILPQGDRVADQGDAGVATGSEIGAAGGPISPALAGQINAKRGDGAALDAGTQARMERTFGTSFADVHLHTDGDADRLNRRVSARAFTTGSDIYFRADAYQPGSNAGNQLLGHELTHVVQQRGMRGDGPLAVGPGGDSYEQEADAVGAAVAATHQAGAAAPLTMGMAMGGGAPPALAPSLVRAAGNQVAGQLSRQYAIQRDDDGGNTNPGQPAGDQNQQGGGDGQYVEETDDFQPEDGGEYEADLVVQQVDDGSGGGQGPQGGQQDQAPAAPAIQFVDLGRVDTARFGDPDTPFAGMLPRAFTDGGQKGTVVWAGGGGAGAHGNEAVGSLQTYVPPKYFQPTPKKDAFIRETTGRIDVTRSWTGVNAGDQGNGHFLTVAAAARINQHETQHVANTSGHYAADIDPLLQRVADKTMDVVIANALMDSAVPRTIPALKAFIKWTESVTHFKNADTADNKPGGAVDTADLASGTYPVDVGPGTVGGKNFAHRVRTPGEPNPAP